MEPKKYNKMMTVSGDKLTALTGIVYFLMSCAWMFAFVYAFFIGHDSIASLIIQSCFSLSAAIIMGFFAYRNLSLGFAKVSVYKNGIYYSSLFRKKLLPWSSIADFGILAGMPLGKHIRKRYYDLYFSESKIANKDERLRLFELKPVMLTIKAQDRVMVYRRILTYVQKETGIKPFVPDSFFSS